MTRKVQKPNLLLQLPVGAGEKEIKPNCRRDIYPTIDIYQSINYSQDSPLLTFQYMKKSLPVREKTLFSLVTGTVQVNLEVSVQITIVCERTHIMKKRPLSVFCEGWPGLSLANLNMLTQPIAAVDVHAPLEAHWKRMDQSAIRSFLGDLRKVLEERDLLLDAIVFGLPGEDYADPATAKATVGFAAPDKMRRAHRFQDAAALATSVYDTIPAEFFVRGQVTLKGHFGAFDASNEDDYEHLIACLKNMSLLTLQPKNVLMLAETGCESAEDIIQLIGDVQQPGFGCNWDTANLDLWGEDIDNFEYAELLAIAGLLRGIHIKGGKAPSAAGQWGVEIEPSAELIAKALAVLEKAPCFDGPITVEREKFLQGSRESQEEKAAGLSDTLKLIAAEF